MLATASVSAVDRDKALAIMKDPRIGSYGAVGLILMLGLKGGLPAGPGEDRSLAALLALAWAHAASRAAGLALGIR